MSIIILNGVEMERITNAFKYYSIIEIEKLSEEEKDKISADLDTLIKLYVKKIINIEDAKIWFSYKGFSFEEKLKVIVACLRKSLTFMEYSIQKNTFEEYESEDEDEE